MSRDYTKLPATQVRRRDRAVEEDGWIAAFLQRAPMGVLALSFEDKPFANSNLFVYDEDDHAILLHTAAEGRTRSIVERQPRACFSVSEMGRLLPADKALEFSVEYAGVSIFGRVEIVEAPQEAARALQRLLDKYFPHLTVGEDYRPVVPEELKRTTVFRLRIEEWVGKQKKVDADFPGAFLFPSSS